MVAFAKKIDPKGRFVVILVVILVAVSGCGCGCDSGLPPAGARTRRSACWSLPRRFDPKGGGPVNEKREERVAQ